jgi:hypothetical protein
MNNDKNVQMVFRKDDSVAVMDIINFGHENLHILNYSKYFVTYFLIKRAAFQSHINESYGSSLHYT